MPPKIPSVLAIANEGGAVLIGVSDTAGAYRSVIGGPDHRLWLTPRRDLAKTYVWNWHEPTVRGVAQVRPLPVEKLMYPLGCSDGDF